MNRREFEHYLQLIIPDIFSFVWALTGNTSQSEKVIWSTLEALHIQESDLLDRLAVAEEQTELLELYKLHAYSHAYYIVSKGDNKKSNAMDAYDALDLKEKAILFLRHRTPLSMEEISDVLDVEKTMAMSVLYSAREKLKELSHVYEEKVG